MAPPPSSSEVFIATTELTCGPRVHHRPAARLRRAPTATPRCYRLTAAVPWEQAPEQEPEQEPGQEQPSELGPERAVGAEQEPGQPSGAAERERPWAARARTGPWPQPLRP